MYVIFVRSGFSYYCGSHADLKTSSPGHRSHPLLFGPVLSVCLSAILCLCGPRATRIQSTIEHFPANDAPGSRTGSFNNARTLSLGRLLLPAHLTLFVETLR